MLPFLIRVGRMATVISAVVTVLGAVALGWFYGIVADRMWYGYANLFAVTPNRLGLAVLGGCIGVLLAGAFYGAAAALFEIHRHLRNMDPTRQVAP